MERHTYIGRNQLFIVLSFLFIIDCLVVYANIEHGAEILMLNTIATPWLDRIFIPITNIGLGSVLIIVAPLLTLKKIKYAFAALTAIAFTGLLTYISKQMLFTDTVRPFCYFAEYNLHIIEGFDYACNNTFPSGHTMCAFAFATVASAVSRSKTVQILFFIYAILVGISRMYLLQHFMIDVAAGAFLGILSAHFSLWLWSGFKPRWSRLPLLRIPLLRKHRMV